MTAYTLLRKVHLYSGLVLLTFVVMYFVTGYPMIHHSWFPDPEPVKSTRTEPLSYAGPMEPEAYSLYLQEAFGLRGKRQPGRRMDDGGWRFRYFRPGSRGRGDLGGGQRPHLQARGRAQRWSAFIACTATAVAGSTTSGWCSMTRPACR